jgi:hypothetical protein
MYVTKDVYGTDHSTIFSTQVNNCTVHSITYRYKGVCYPLYSKHNTGILRERRGIEYGITGMVNRYSNSMKLYCIIKDTQPADATEYVNSSLTRAECGTPR